MTFLTQFKAARRVSAPLVLFRTPDQVALIRRLLKSLNGEAPPAIQWDIINGMVALNDKGMEALLLLMGNAAQAIVEASDGTTTLEDAVKQAAQAKTSNPVEALSRAVELPADTLLFLLNTHLYLGKPSPDSAAFSQSVFNLREPFKDNGRMLCMTAPSVTLPEELANDVLIIDEPYPTPEELAEIVATEFQNAKQSDPDYPEPTSEIIVAAADALRGLPSFPADQAVAMCLEGVRSKDQSRKGLNIEGLRDRTKKIIAEIPGLKVERCEETFDNLAGLSPLIELGREVYEGPCRPRVIVRWEEIEKTISTTDSSGTGQDQLAMFLQYLQDYEWKGVLLNGIPGCGKSLWAKAYAKTYSLLGLMIDPGAAQNKYVGESGTRIRRVMETLVAIGGKRGVFFAASSNRFDRIPPELGARFGLGTYFFDRSEAEMPGIWKISMAKYGLKEQDLPDDSSWVGRDVDDCCSAAWIRNISLVKAAQSVVPVLKARSAEMDELRQKANGKFLNANAPGIYTVAMAVSAPKGGRQIRGAA